jgi:ethanolaminephosphotransferase
MISISDIFAEGLIIASAMMIISGWFGPSFWTTPFVDAIPSLASFVGPTTNLADIWVPLVFGAFLFGHLPACVKHVYEARSEKGQPMAPLFLEWIPIVVFITACTAWLVSPYSWLLEDNHLCLFCVTMSLVFGRMTTKIILAHLTRQPFPYWTVLLTPLVAGAVISNLPGFGLRQVFDQKTELYYVWAYFVFAFVVYARWAHLVITSICEFLSINCLTIPREKWRNANGGPVITGRPASPKKD